MEKIYEAIVQAKQYAYCTVYGAQAVAYGVSRALDTAFALEVMCYVVASRDGNPMSIDGKKVILLNELTCCDTDIFFFIAVPEYLHAEITHSLKEKGYHHFYCIDSDSEYVLMKAFFCREKGICFSEDLVASESTVADGSLQMEVYVAKSARDKFLKTSDDFPYGHRMVQAGAAIDAQRNIADFRDDTGDNISVKNCNYAELTVTYWAWKNRHIPYKGIAHYRRYLSLTEADRAALLTGKVDVVLPLPFICYPDASTQYLRYNQPAVIMAMFQALSEKKIGLDLRAKEILAGKYLYNYNMLIAKEAVFNDYCAWIFPVLERVEGLCGEILAEQPPDRLCGHLGEVLTSLYFSLYAKDLRVVHARKVWLV